MKYLVIDASLNGTGIRDKLEGGYIAPRDLDLSCELIQQLNTWLQKYEDEHYNGYSNERTIDILDLEGKEIAYKIKEELSDVKLEYFSDARMKREIL